MKSGSVSRNRASVAFLYHISAHVALQMVSYWTTWSSNTRVDASYAMTPRYALNKVDSDPFFLDCGSQIFDEFRVRSRARVAGNPSSVVY